MSAIDIGELRALLTLQDNFSGPLAGAEKQMGIFSGAFGAITAGAGLFVAGVTAAAAATIALGSHGSDVQDVREAFADLTAEAGSTADVMLGALRAGTVGAISDFDLMKMATKTLGGHLVTSAEDMKTLAGGARELAKATGTDTAEAFQSLTKAMATGRTTGLAAKGLFVDTAAATQQYANSLGVSASELTKHQKAAAGAEAILAALRDRFKDTAPADFGELVGRITAQVTNFTDSLSVGVARSPVLTSGLKAAGDAIEKCFGAKGQGAISDVVGLIQQAAIWTTKLASVALTAADLLHTGFYAAQVAVHALVGGLVDGVSSAFKFFAGIADSASILPVVGDKMKDLANGLRGGAMTADLMSKGFEQLQLRAMDSADATGRGYGKVKAVIDAAHDAMVKASTAQDGATEAVKRHGAATAEVATAATADLQKIAEAHQKLEDDISLIGTVGIERRMLENEIAQQRELDNLSKLKGLSVDQYDEMANLISEKYTKIAAGAKLGADQIRDTTKKLTEDIALARTTGLEQELMQIEFARQTELDGLANLAANYGAQYTAIVALVNEKYAQMAAAAQGQGLTVQQMAGAAGFKSRDELNQTAETAEATYQQMLASGQYTDDELAKAKEKSEEAQRAAMGETVKYAYSAGAALLTGASQVLSVLGQKNKTAAIAGAIIDTYMAVAKSIASAPWPFSLALAAGALAAGMANVSKIKSAPSGGYEVGTPGTHFLDFGRGTSTTLHGQEAVVTKSQGESLAGMLMDAVEGGGGRSEAIHVHVHIDGREAAQAIVPHIPRVLARAGVGG
jgi:hypothetical protein